MCITSKEKKKKRRKNIFFYSFAGEKKRIKQPANQQAQREAADCFAFKTKGSNERRNLSAQSWVLFFLLLSVICALLAHSPPLNLFVGLSAAGLAIYVLEKTKERSNASEEKYLNEKKR
jgi:Mg2+/citrate symporter